MMENKRMCGDVPHLYDTLGKTRYLDVDIIIHLCVDIVWMSPPWQDVGQCWAVAWLQWPHTEHSSTASISSGPLSRGGGLHTQSPPATRPECYYHPQELFCIRSSSLATHCEHTQSEQSSQASETSDGPGNLLETLVQWRPWFWT